MKDPIKMTPGDDLHLTLLMAPYSLNLAVGQFREQLLGYGRAAFEAGKAAQCLLQIQEPATAVDTDGMYYLQDARWSAMVGTCPSFWRPDGNGYTTNLDEAARFTFAEAMAQHRCRDTDLPWLCAEVDKLRRATVDCQYMPRSWDDQRAAIAAQAAQGGEHASN